MIDKDEINKTAVLSQLPLPEGEALDDLQKTLSNILGLVKQLESVDTDDVSPMAHPLEVAQRLREDSVTEGDQRDVLQAPAPNAEKGFYLVPRIIE